MALGEGVTNVGAVGLEPVEISATVTAVGDFGVLGQVLSNKLATGGLDHLKLVGSTAVGAITLLLNTNILHGNKEAEFWRKLGGRGLRRSEEGRV
jgi:hypothetical protein